MNRKYNLKLDLQFRCNNSIMKFNQFDNNTSDFFIKISNGGKSFDVEKAIVVLAIIKPSGKVASQFVEVENGLVYADLKSNMRDEIGTYTAKAMLILEDERVVTDSISYEVEEDKIFSLLNDTVGTSEEFTLLTDMLSRLSAIEISEEQRVINEAERILSEENRKIEEAKRVEAELIRQHEEADRSKYDATRESNENIRKQNESIRLANEANRIDEEAKRVEEEAKRVEAEQLRKDNYNFMTEDEERRRSEANAHKEAEKLRAQAETNRVNEEAKRRTTEQTRISAENTRVSNESARKANETTRQTNETHRVEAETQRQNRYNSFIADAEINANNFENYTNSAKIKEEERKSNELNRKSQEDRRVSNEVERISNENTRKANEVAREKNETSRQYVFENKVNEVDKKIVELNTTKDNFVSNINTKVDTKISEIDNVKDNFVSSISTKVDNKISELDSAKSDMTNTVSNKVNEVENRFNALTSKQQQNAEVIDARDGEISLKARLDRDIEKAKQVYVNVEGSHISTDSSVGYLKDVEILGNTIQDASNLADIRSVGDKVDGQELYEIPVLSVGKNLFDGNKFTPREAINQYSYIDGILTMRCDGQAYRRVDYILPNTLVHGKRYILTANVKALEYSSGYTPGQNFGYGYYNGGSADYYGSFDASSNTTKLEFVYNEQGENVIGFHNEVKEGLTKLQWSNIQLEEGTQATPYEPYQEDKLTILSPTQLEKVGDVRDRIIEKNGVFGVEKNIETYHPNVNKIYNYLSMENSFRVSSNSVDAIITPKTSRSICNLLIEGVGSDWTLDKQCCYVLTNNTLVIKGDIRNASNLEEAREWIKSSGLYVKYPTTQPQFIPLPHSQQVKLRTFANKTNISFGCEIEGTIKAQVPKSLGATVNTHTEQINNLNKELDRVKKLEESTVSTVVTESSFTTIEATNNGYFEDVKLEGKTLVNICKGEIIESGLDMQITVYKQSQIATIINNSNKKIYFDTNNIDGTYKKSLTIAPNSIFLYEQDNDLIKLLNAHNTFGWTFSEKEYFKNNCFILEGDHTQNPPNGYIEGLKSVGQGVDEIVVESVNPNGNLFDGTLEVGSISADGKLLEWSPFVRTDYINVKPGVSVFCKVVEYDGITPNIQYSQRLCEYDINKNFIKSTAENKNVVVLSDKTKYIRYSEKIESNDMDRVDLSKVNKLLVCYASSETDYTPYQSDKKRLLYYNDETQTWEKPILREWDNIEKHANGKYYYHKRSAEVVLNGSENWLKTSSQPTSGNHSRFIITNFPKDVVQALTVVICDKYNNQKLFNESSVGIYVDKNINITVDGVVEVEEFKNNLNTNNVTVVYQLAQEKVYECTNIDLITYANETNYVVESGVLSPRTTLKVHNNISNVVSLLQKKVSLLESNVTSYMITQNRLMLASRYNADNVTFKVDYPSMMSEREVEIDYDLFKLIQDNIIVGPENYDVDKMLEIMDLYAMIGFITWEMWDYLYEVIDSQINPVIGDLEGAPEI